MNLTNILNSKNIFSKATFRGCFFAYLNAYMNDRFLSKIKFTERIII